mmetsp:Transcript_2359/g.3629  ORF Transcript_2359/g.3629 Transcript_2359/m.3629 type:complete len:388 (-) Transcript_2359:16-1179(-)
MNLTFTLLGFFVVVLVHFFGSCSSDELVEELRAKATTTFARIRPCLINSNHTRSIGKTFDNLNIPDDILEHYKFLLGKTERMRKLPIHSSAGYSGPWIENHYISHFLSKPLSYFNGLVPLFVQFVDTHVNDFRTKIRPNPTLKETSAELASLLRDDLIYVVVSQDDQGITADLFEKKPNILVLSAGGYGHIPIPLIKGELSYVEPRKNNKYEWDVSFCGSSSSHPSRTAMLIEAEKEIKLKGLSYVNRNGPIAQFVEQTKVNLAPRGYGRSSYRFAEIVQVGRIPVYMFNDFSWAAYEGTPAAITEFGFHSQLGDAVRLVEGIQAVVKNDTELNRRFQKVKEVRQLYTYGGLIQQIELFFADPLGPSGGYLRCAKVPDSENRKRAIL